MLAHKPYVLCSCSIAQVLQSQGLYEVHSVSAVIYFAVRVHDKKWWCLQALVLATTCFLNLCRSAQSPLLQCLLYYYSKHLDFVIETYRYRPRLHLLVALRFVMYDALLPNRSTVSERHGFTANLQHSCL